MKKSPNEPPKAVAASVRKPRRHTAADSMDWGASFPPSPLRLDSDEGARDSSHDFVRVGNSETCARPIRNKNQT